MLDLEYYLRLAEQYRSIPGCQGAGRAIGELVAEVARLRLAAAELPSALDDREACACRPAPIPEGDGTFHVDRSRCPAHGLR